MRRGEVHGDLRVRRHGDVLRLGVRGRDARKGERAGDGHGGGGDEQTAHGRLVAAARRKVPAVRATISGWRRCRRSTSARCATHRTAQARWTSRRSSTPPAARSASSGSAATGSRAWPSSIDLLAEFFAEDEAAKARDRDGPRRRGVARLVPGRRRADLWPAGPQGRPVLRRRARADDPRVRAGTRCTARTCSRPAGAAARRGAALDRAAERPRPRRCSARWRSGSASTPDLVRAPTLTADPTVLFRIFHYPPRPPATDGWGVAEHTDYGLLTILAQDDDGGPAGAHARTAGSTCRPNPTLVRVQHRRHARPHDRRPLPLDPAPGAQRRPRPSGCRSRSSSIRRGTPRCRAARAASRSGDPAEPAGTAPTRAEWDGEYGDYLTAKVARVFPALFSRVTP